MASQYVDLPVSSGSSGVTSLNSLTGALTLAAGTNITITPSGGNTLTIDATGSGTGTVTSVAMTVPTFLSVSGSPITTSGTLAVTLSGTALPIANGGTGQTMASAAFNALSPLTTAGDLLYGGASGAGTRLGIGSSGQILTVTGGNPVWAAPATAGTVTSVALTVPAEFSISGSPITTSGTLAVTKANQNANIVYSGPSSGGAAAPTFRALVAADLPSNSKIKSFGITIDGAGSAITTGVKGYIVVPYACTITGWTVLADQTGSIVIDVWKDTYANFPPTVADTITGADKPTISAAQKGQNLTLSAWTTTVSAGDTIGFNVDSCATITRVTLTIQATAT